ncbi:MAG: DUF3794 domain-containing protein [Clostridia bacterium]|nr:DUF3794 domain-containing protein [Clostridia bacterium]
MDISLKHTDYHYLKALSNSVVEEVVECDFTLPEYMPEILRVIKSSATPKVTSCRLVGERITVDGVCELRLVYTAEDDAVYSFTQSRSFTRYCENTAYADCVDVSVRAGVSYVNCRATGTKRAEMKAGISLTFSGWLKESADIISLDRECGVEAKCEFVRAMSLGCRQTKQFSMSDTVTLDVPSAFVISTRGSAVCTEIRKINNKIMVKGDSVVDVCYVDVNNRTQRIKHLIPINQIMEFEGMEERFTGNVSLSVCCVDVIPKGESGGACSCFDISLGVDATVTMWEEMELNVISDAYAIGKGIELKKVPCKFYSAVDEIRETFASENNLTLCAEGVSEVVDLAGEITNVTVTNDGERLNLNGSLALSFIVKDNSGTLSSVNKMMDFSFVRNMGRECSNVVCSPVVTLVSLDCGVKNGGVAVRGEINAVGTVMDEITIDAVVDISESDIPVAVNHNAITIYFPEKENESLWSIARRYNTTVNAIAEENCLEGDTTENLKILFIPAV